MSKMERPSFLLRLGFTSKHVRTSVLGRPHIGQLTPGKMDEKLKSENVRKRAIFYVYAIFYILVQVQLLLTTLGQETRWAYSTTPPSPHGALRRHGCAMVAGNCQEVDADRRDDPHRERSLPTEGFLGVRARQRRTLFLLYDSFLTSPILPVSVRLIDKPVNREFSVNRLTVNIPILYTA